jgi:hypothetical protein
MLAPSRVSTGQEGSTRRICNAHAWTTQASAPAQPSRKSGGDVRVAARLVGLPPARPPPHLYQTLVQRPLLLQTATPVLQPPGQDGVAGRPVTPAVGRKRPLPSLAAHHPRRTAHDTPQYTTTTTCTPCPGTLIAQETRRDAPQPRVRRAAVAVLPCPRVALMPPCPPPKATHAPPAPSIPMGAARPHEALSLP